MAIKAGFSPIKADEVMNAMGRILKNQSEIIFDADLKGFETTTDFTNFYYDTLQDTTNLDSASDILDYPFFGAKVLDDFEDGTIDSNIWTNSGWTEANGYVQASLTSAGTSTLTADQVNSIDVNQECTILAKCFFRRGSGGASIRMNIEDESSNTASIILHTGSDGVDIYFDARLEIDPTSNEIRYFTNFAGSGTSSDTDISSLQEGDKWTISLALYSDGSTTKSARFYFIRYLENAATESDLILEAEDVGETITNAFVMANYDAPSGTSIDFYLSADGGSNYEQVTENEIHRFTDTGTDLKVKAVLNSSADQVATLNHVGVYYNIG